MKEGFRYSTASSARSSRSEEEMKDGLSLRYSTVSSSSSSSSRRIGKRCLLIAKQQRTRFYILRRCITMLLCWHAHAVRDWYILSIYLSLICIMYANWNQSTIHLRRRGKKEKKKRKKLCFDWFGPSSPFFLSCFSWVWIFVILVSLFCKGEVDLWDGSFMILSSYPLLVLWWWSDLM